MLATAAVAAVALAACGSGDGAGGSGTDASGEGSAAAQAEARAPHEELVTLEVDEALAQSATSTFFEHAPVVVLDDGADPRTTLRAAGTAVALGVPMLAAGTPETDAELERLEAQTLLAFGSASLPAENGELALVAAPGDDEALAELVDLPLGEERPVAEGDEVEALAALDTGEIAAWQWDEDASDGADTPPGTDPDDDGDAGSGDDDATDPATPEESGELPETQPAEPVDGMLVLSAGDPAEMTAVATARAAGADVAVSPQRDPRSTSASVAAVAEAQATHVVVLGEGWGDEETLEWQLRTAATGVELPGGGQLVLPGNHYVALYGNPTTEALGVLGEQGVDATIERAAQHAADYDDLMPGTVVPALEIIATVASAAAGHDGNYSNVMADDVLRPLVEAAGDAGQYVVLDLQPGRSSFLEQAQRYEELLRLPHVGLALDPEWNLGPDEQHMVRIGSVSAAEVNEVVDWLADLTREESLPQKLLVLHQFQVRMIDTVADVDLSRGELAVLIHADGQGGQSAKQDTWRTLHANAEDVEWWGWKNFYEEDLPMLTPEQTVEQVDPVPDFISYQ